MLFRDAAADLLVQGSCPGCGLPGQGICARCRQLILAGKVGPRQRVGIDLLWWAAGAYIAPLPRILSQAKDHQRWDALELLGRRLASAVAGVADSLALSGQGVLIPFPSQPAAVRARGLDVTAALTRLACRRLRAVGLSVQVWPMLSHVRRVQDQSGLDTARRQANLVGSLQVVRPPPPGWQVLVDDVVTTGASLREGVRALRAAGHAPAGLASVAATVLRHPVLTAQASGAVDDSPGKLSDRTTFSAPGRIT